MRSTWMHAEMKVVSGAEVMQTRLMLHRAPANVWHACGDTPSVCRAPAGGTSEYCQTECVMLHDTVYVTPHRHQRVTVFEFRR